MKTGDVQCHELYEDCSEVKYRHNSYKYKLDFNRECSIKNHLERIALVDHPIESAPVTVDPVQQYDLLTLVGEKLRYRNSVAE